MENLVPHFIELIRRAACDLPADMEESLRQARAVEAPGSAAQTTLDTILENVALSRERSTPICQDTGTPIFYICYPTGWSTIELRRQIKEAVAEATLRSYLRPNAVDALVASCDSGDFNSCISLGVMLRHGQGIKADQSRAAALYKKACDGGVAKGCSNLGYLYQKGFGVTIDYAKAAKLYELACENEGGDGCTGLGILNERGLGTEPDFEMAAEFYLLGCDFGDRWGCNNRGVMHRDGIGVAKDQNLARRYLDKACKMGLDQSCGFLRKLGE